MSTNSQFCCGLWPKICPVNDLYLDNIYAANLNSKKTEILK